MSAATQDRTRKIAGGYTVVIDSKPGAAVTAERIVLTKEQRKRLVVPRGFWLRFLRKANSEAR